MSDTIETAEVISVVDHRGRPVVESMSDSEKLTELLLIMRALFDQFESMGANAAGMDGLMGKVLRGLIGG